MTTDAPDPATSHSRIEELLTTLLARVLPPAPVTDGVEFTFPAGAPHMIDLT